MNLKRATNLQELQDFAHKHFVKGETGHLFVNQLNQYPEEPIFSDEDVSGRQALQLLKIVIQAGSHAIYYEYPFFEGTELEEINVQLKGVYDQFPKKVISKEEMEAIIQSEQR